MSKGLLPADLIRLAELVKMSAETARLFSDTSPNGKASAISAVAARIEAAADELKQIGQEMQRKPPTGL